MLLHRLSTGTRRRPAIDPIMSADDASTLKRLRDAIALHFDPQRGAPFWLSRASRWSFDPRTVIRTVEDLSRIEMIQPADLARTAIEDLLPAPAGERRAHLMIAQTGGTTGQPVWTAYAPDEFDEAFVTPFVAAARHVGFPFGGNWLYVGPSGPHIIARAADAIARSTGSMPPFSVDFDPRWAAKLPEGSFAAQRYLHHLVDQATAVLKTQSITTLFSTPIVVKALSEALSPHERIRITGIHYGGMALPSAELDKLQTEAFPNAVHLSGYGNTLFGCCLELTAAAHRELSYYPHGDRIILGTIDDTDPARRRACYDRSSRTGQLVFSRLDSTVLLLNIVERDRVRICNPPLDAPPGFRLPGAAGPVPIRDHRARTGIGLY